jgi:high-affinity nickel permease
VEISIHRTLFLVGVDSLEPATVFEVWTVVVVVRLAVVVVVGLAVVVDPLVVLAEIGGLVGWLVDDGWTVSRVD